MFLQVVWFFYVGKFDDYLLLVSNDVVDGFLNGGDFFSFFVRDFGFEFFFQSYYQFDGVKGVGVQVFDEGSVVGDFFFFYVELFSDDFFNVFFDGVYILFLFLWKI